MTTNTILKTNEAFIEDVIKKVSKRNQFDENLLRSTLKTLESKTSVFEESHLEFIISEAIKIVMYHNNKIMWNNLNIKYYLDTNPLSDAQKNLLSNYWQSDLYDKLIESKKSILSVLKLKNTP